MSVWPLTVIILNGVWRARVFAWHPNQYHTTPQFLQQLEEMPGVAQVSGAGEDRGPRWYDSRSSAADSDINKENYESSGSSLITTDSKSSRRSTDVSSFETSESKMRTRAYRECTPCALDMIRKYTNMGIKWICAGYQRARRTFKSECMMRFRNCQDGTMFVKIADHRCSDDPYHGRHWFYIYRV